MAALIDSLTIFHLALAVALFGTAALLTRLVIRINIADLPDHRSSHTHATPTGGGIAIAVVFCSTLPFFGLAGGSDIGASPALAVFAGLACLVSILFLLDDIWTFPVLPKLLIQLGVAVAFVSMIGHVERLWLPGHGMLEFGLWGYPLTVFWIVGFMNAFNCLDGVHGLASGGTLIASFILAVIALVSGAAPVAFACLVLFSATLGFFVFNFPGGRIFMGDAGSQFIGFVFAGLAVLGANTEEGRISFYVVPLLFYGFIFDFVLTVVMRLYKRSNIFRPHRQHLFQLCHRLGLSPPQICSIHLVFFLLNGVFALLAQWGAPWQRLYLTLLLLPVYCIYAVLVLRTARRRALLDSDATAYA